MDWANERYVRLYVRETPDQALWCWQALAIWPWLVVRAERSGELSTRKGAAGLAALLRIPLEVVEPGIADLLADGCLVETHRGYAIPNYVDAQNATSSDSKRKADQRARERLDSAIKGKDVNISVTPGHEASRDVTESHEASRDVTPIRSDPNRTEDPPIPPKGGPAVAAKRAKRPRPSDPTPDEMAVATRVLGKITERTGIGYEVATSRGPTHHARLIASRLRDGLTERELRGIAAYCWSSSGLEWERKPEMHKYLRPETLFGPQTIHKYLPGARTFLAEHFSAAPSSVPSEAA